jgi:transposase-like protein/ribosomal protein L37AE/L43A
VARPDFPLTILEFQQRFGTEDACREYLFASRWPDGFICPACGGRDAGAKTRRHLWVCTACGRQTSITAGTVMHKTRLPLRTWFWASYLVSTFHPGISAKQLQRQLGVGCHETAWAMLHKLRGAMVAPERDPLKGEVEIDEFFLGGHEEGLKGGRQHGKKALVGIAIEVRGQGSGRLRLQVLENSQAKTLEAFTKATTAPGAIVHTDGLPSYNGLPKLGYDHRPRKVASVEPGEELLPRVHRAVSNLKAWMHGTHRGVSDAHLQVYLDEYVFRHNRRRTPMASFQTLLGLSARHEPITYRDIIDQAA